MEEKSKALDRKIVEINIAEYPIFLSHRNVRLLEYSVMTGNGEFTVSCSRGLPDTFDMKVLMCLLSKAHAQQSPKVHFTLKEIARELGGNVPVQRIKDSIERWGNTVVTFKESFLEAGGQRTSISFAVFLEKFEYWEPKTGVGKKKSREYTFVVLHPTIMQNIRDRLFKYVNWEFFKSLGKGLSSRLYLYLITKLGEQDQFRISLSRLCEILPLFTKHTPLALRYIKNGLQPLVDAKIIDYRYIPERQLFIFSQPRKGLPEAALGTPEFFILGWLTKDLSYLGISDQKIPTYLKNAERTIKALFSVDMNMPKNPLAFFKYMYREENFNTEGMLHHAKSVARNRVETCERIYFKKNHNDSSGFHERLKKEIKRFEYLKEDSPFEYYYSLVHLSEEIAHGQSQPFPALHPSLVPAK